MVILMGQVVLPGLRSKCCSIKSVVGKHTCHNTNELCSYSSAMTCWRSCGLSAARSDAFSVSRAKS